MNDLHSCGFQDHEGHRCSHKINVEFTLIGYPLSGGAYLCPVHRMIFDPPLTPWRVYLEEGGHYIENAGVQVR